jgi:hypothetical protein
MFSLSWYCESRCWLARCQDKWPFQVEQASNLRTSSVGVIVSKYHEQQREAGTMLVTMDANGPFSKKDPAPACPVSWARASPIDPRKVMKPPGHVGTAELQVSAEWAGAALNDTGTSRIAINRANYASNVLLIAQPFHCFFWKCN